MSEVKPDQNSKGLFRPGNRVNVTHGVYGFLATGSLPRKATYIRRQLGELRNAIEAAVLEKFGELTLYRAALVQTAIRHEGRACLLQRWLRLNGKLTHAEKLATLKEIGAASDARDRALKALGLDERDDGRSILEGLYGPVRMVNEPKS